MTYKAMDIANWFIWRNELEDSENEKMTLLKLLKLLYYAEGCFLALDKGDLFSEEIVAWEHGPVVEEVYRNFSDPYNLTYDKNSAEKVNQNIDDKEILEQVFNIFGSYTAWALRNKTHSETPWLKATGGGKYLNKKISKEDIKNYFKENYIEG